MFEGHPNLSRLLTHDAFVGHGMRKDYPAAPRHVLKSPKEWLLEVPPDNEHPVVNIGPSHPAMHGTFRVQGVMDGETIQKAASGIKNVERVITGHSTVMPWQDFVDFGEFNRVFLSHARESLKAGKTPEQAMMDFTLPEKFTGYTITGGRGGPGGNFGVIFEELKTAK